LYFVVKVDNAQNAAAVGVIFLTRRVLMISFSPQGLTTTQIPAV